MPDPDAMAAADALRSELLFLDQGGSATRVDDCIVILTPAVPTYWWGNTLAFDAAPAAGDFARWNALFDRHVRTAIPGALHTTFGWDGEERGCIEPFVEAGFTYFEMIVLAAERSTPLGAPHVDGSISIRLLGSADWTALADLLVDSRDADKHAEAGYRTFVEGRITQWRRLVEAGRGAWLGAFEKSGSSERLLSSLGVFAEAAAGADGRRIGRYQQVATRIEARRRGLAGMLVERAARHAFDVLSVDTLLIIADDNDVAKRVYRSVGFMPHGWQRGLEYGPK